MNDEGFWFPSECDSEFAGSICKIEVNKIRK